MNMVGVSMVSALLEGSTTNVDHAALLIQLEDVMVLVLFGQARNGPIGVELQGFRYGVAIQPRRDNAFHLLGIGRIGWGMKPKSDAEDCIVQLFEGNCSSSGIAFLDEEFAVPVATLDQYVGIVGLGLGLGLGHTRSKADLGLPAGLADALPRHVVEGQRSVSFGNLRKIDEAAFRFDGMRYVRDKEYQYFCDKY